MNDILICNNSGLEVRDGETVEDRRHPRIPLVTTFAWDGAERWCPWCDRLFDIFGGRRVTATDELIRVRKRIDEAVKPYLENVYARREDKNIETVEWADYQDFYGTED